MGGGKARGGWWERLEREYREKRLRDDEARQERRRRELMEARDWRGAPERAKKYECWSTQVLLEEAGRMWGVDFFEADAGKEGTSQIEEVRLQKLKRRVPSELKVEVVVAEEKKPRQENVWDVALRIIFHLN